MSTTRELHHGRSKDLITVYLFSRFFSSLLGLLAAENYRECAFFKLFLDLTQKRIGMAQNVPSENKDFIFFGLEVDCFSFSFGEARDKSVSGA